eukprot:3005249-Pleurochrysis_carterae.AAC.1
MGNASSTSQWVEQTVQNYTEANAISNAKSQCTQDIKITVGAMINCPGITANQTCSAMANASLDTVVKALQEAELDKEAEQAMEGLALGANVDVSKQNMRNTLIQKL